MQFGPVPTESAEGCILAHSLQLAGGRIPKGTILTPDHIEAIEKGGIENVTVCRLEPGDVLEDDAASAVAQALDTPHTRQSEATTGRVNIYSTENGLFIADRTTVDSLNRIDPGITLATIADHSAVTAGAMVATVKIIPLAVASSKVEAAAQLVRGSTAFSFRPYRPHRVVLIATALPTLKPSVMDRTARLLAQRLEPSGSSVHREERVAHDTGEVAAALVDVTASGEEQPDLIVIFGASAVADPDDVIPAAIRASGGRVEQVGMPVDPGNLLVLGAIGDIPVIGAPGCARSPKENGFDWILNRILAGERPRSFDITGMGVGGLLMEIPERPRPRDAVQATEGEAVTVGALLLAAGQARRMGEGGPHKLLASFGGVPLVRRSAETLLAAGLRPVVAVTGHRHEKIEATLAGVDVKTVFNPDYASGMASSLVTGLSSHGVSSCEGVLVMLADMPAVSVTHISRMVEAFRNAGGQAVVRAVHDGKRGNPIILPHATFEAVRKLQGDVGARSIVENCGLPTIDIEIGRAAHIDVDTPEAVVAAGGILGD
ncbi:L-seryl-tRNA(Ser) selenium transferase protein [Pseudorhizobium banfieldiae]|uniref:L-seryl-tRNA(Ser) selenium transferase protein n=1 Tax=Pseudorhizobium banfieldiae TaxID=1125847 RepID=L0NEU2_9HYPH|nr:molybdopterin-binding/glycosyltransferase family 2 protein [Pseudorhizobium banfieldiae]CAD6609759.1 4-diphosphocytidyl-2C-methyl-D-erythritol kinase [arsenite-oxidising bacterium NT-25]CCF19590.1 L-seryl-tRNA(Ser) selenium transferase protein [Pseudorhizobium banfieldiae]